MSDGEVYDVVVTEEVWSVYWLSGKRVTVVYIFNRAKS